MTLIWRTCRKVREKLAYDDSDNSNSAVDSQSEEGTLKMGIVLLNGALIKPGRLASGSYLAESPIHGEPFGSKGKPVPVFSDPTGPLSKFNTGVVRSAGGHPTATQYNLATQPEIIATNTGYNGFLELTLARRYGTLSATVQPHEHGRFFGEKKRDLIRNTLGPGKNAHGQKPDTPFHPRKTVVPNRPKRHLAVAGERTAAPSFRSHARLMYDPNFKPHGGASRWATVKRGAAG
jgi:hypothetical protein